MSLFVSTVVNKVDRKGRVSVPALWRVALSGPLFSGIFCYPSFDTPCLDGMNMERLDRLAESLDRLDVFSVEQNDIAQLIFASVRQLPFDTEGRVMLPDDLIQHAGLAQEAAFVGCGKTFQVWEPTALRLAQDKARKRALQMRPTLRLEKGGP